MNSVAGPTDCRAWLLPVHGTMHVAVGEPVLVHVVSERLRAVSIPGAPAWCRSLFLWQGQVIPVFQFAALLASGGEAQQAAAGTSIVAILAFADAAGITRYGGVRLTALPVKRSVGDDQACEVPPSFARCATMAASCFRDPGHGAVPVLDLDAVFCTVPGEHGGDGRVHP